MGKYLTNKRNVGIGFLLILFPIVLFFLWKSELFNKMAFSFSVSKEAKFWAEIESKTKDHILNLNIFKIDPGYDRDILVIDSLGNILFQFGNRFSFFNDSLGKINKPTFIETRQGLFLCNPLSLNHSDRNKVLGISCIYYSFSNENDIFKDGPSDSFRYLGEIKASIASQAGSIYILKEGYHNGCYVIFKNPFKGKEVILVLFSLFFLCGLFLLVKSVLNDIYNNNEIIFWNLLLWFFIIINHLIYYFFESKEIEFGNQYILFFQFFNLSYYELLTHLLIVSLVALLYYKSGIYYRQKFTFQSTFSLINIYLLLLFLVNFFWDFVSNYDFIRHLSYYTTGKFVFLNHLLISLIIISILVISIIIYFQILDNAIYKKIFLLVLLLITWLVIKNELILLSISLIILLVFLFVIFKKLDIFKSYKGKINLPVLLIIGLGATIFASMVIFSSLQNNEKHRRFLLLSRLESIETGDPMLVNNFYEVSRKLQVDTTVLKALQEGRISEADSLITNTYFSGAWKQFSLSLTYCTPEDKIRINPSMVEYNCYNYFQSISGLSQKDFDKGVFFVPIEQGNNVKGYLGFIGLKEGDNKSKPAGIFIEFSYSNFSPSFCFADIFYIKGIWNTSETIGYSFARYQKGQLISHSGPAWFPQRLSALYNFRKNMDEFTRNQTQYTYLANEETQTALIIARSENALVKFIGISSVMLFLTIAIGLVFYILVIYDLQHIRELVMLLRVRLQLGILGIVFLVLIVMSLILNDFYVSSLTQWTQRDIRDKVHSLSLEMNSKLQHNASVFSDRNLLLQWLLKLSNIYFLDIIYYNSEGQMQITTIPQAANKTYFNGRLHHTAFQKIISEGLPYYLQEEKLGKFTYYAVYFPVRNGNNFYGVACTPVVAGKPELDNEYRFYTSMMAGLILVILLVALGFAFLLSGLVVKPLKKLSENISRLKIGMRNEKIEVRRQDEIGQLSQMYNQLVDELESAILELRMKERELAWKDVARQIAHEIKNPLTPIKLQIQFLESSFNPADERWRERFSAFTRTLLEKIEELNRLANTFSELAQWPASNPEWSNLGSLVRNNASLALAGFGGKTQIEIPEEPILIKMDKYQMGRVIENLVKNARQAIPNETNGIIKIKLETCPDKVIIIIQDNGVGIDPAQKERVFMPNFTTKSFGMGLGLYISRNIILSHGGEIDFATEPGVGTTFTVRLPKA